MPTISNAVWQGSAAEFLATDPGSVSGRGRAAEWWACIVPLLQSALAGLPSGWVVALDVRLLRLQSRIDAVLVTGRAVLALLIRPGADGFRAADRLAAEDAALDLADFHAGCRGLPVIPVLVVPNGARPGGQRPLPLAGATSVVETTRLLLPGLLREVALFPPVANPPPPWDAAAYRPVPALLDAACLLYARHDVAALLLARTGRDGLARTAAAVARAVHQAQAQGQRLVVFVTGEPGAGKTLCGLNLAFAADASAAFLTGNPTLVHVLREALVRDAARRGSDRRAAQQRMAAVVQALPAFRDHYVINPAPPPEHLVVVDEAQRCWSRDFAVGKTRNRPVPLADSEPGHLLDIMERNPGWSVLVCLVGGGQEIHDGEGGLAAWGEALAARPAWRAVASQAAYQAEDRRQRLPDWPGGFMDRDLHLSDPVRAIHAPDAASWVAAMLDGRAGLARDIAAAAGGVPFQVTRCLDAMRWALRTRGSRTAGLVASSGARRLRAEGLGAVLDHQDEGAVASWFLDRWPDIRSSDALEVAGSEFSVQGLELDRVGLCWDADLIRAGDAWQARRFRANRWTLAGPEPASNRINAYRVLLTRARHGTVIWVPRGAARDPTRDPALYDGVAEYLLRCGATPLDGTPGPADTDPAIQEPALL